MAADDELRDRLPTGYADMDLDQTVVSSGRSSYTTEVFHVDEDCWTSSEDSAWTWRGTLREFIERARSDVPVKPCSHCLDETPEGMEYKTTVNKLRRGELSAEDFGLEPLETPEPETHAR